MDPSTSSSTASILGPTPRLVVPRTPAKHPLALARNRARKRLLSRSTAELELSSQRRCIEERRARGEFASTPSRGNSAILGDLRLRLFGNNGPGA